MFVLVAQHLQIGNSKFKWCTMTRTGKCVGYISASRYYSGRAIADNKETIRDRPVRVLS